MTLDEAIKHCDEVAEENEKQAKKCKDKCCKHTDIANCENGVQGLCHQCIFSYDSTSDKLCECASEHRQLAEWLRELKAYREELPKEIKNVKVRQSYALEANVNNGNYNSHLAEYIKGYLCGLSCSEGIIATIIEEVNADED